jgi:hypothetical protein
METQRLPCKLTQQQLDERRDKMAEQIERLATLEAAKKDAAAQAKAKIEALELELATIAYEVKTRSEIREVEVRREKDYQEGIEETIRQDTGEIVATRVMTPQERQVEFKLVKSAKEVGEKAQ